MAEDIMLECPKCRQHKLPKPKGLAVVCQNGECRFVFNREFKVIGRWTENYVKFLESIIELDTGRAT